jgi:ATP-dependent RNA helicase DDX35
MAEEFELSSSFIPTLYKPATLLPIARHRERLLYLVENFSITIVVGQTGSGKTTQLPQFLDQAGWTSEGKVIAVTQVGKSRCCFTLGHCGEAKVLLISQDEWPPPLWPQG